MESREDEGLWWLPESPEFKVAGTLTYQRDARVRLRLIGHLRRLEDLASDFAPPVIHGTTVDGKDVTLFNCIEEQFQVKMPGMLTGTLVAEVALIGGHFTHETEPRFLRYSISFPNLTAWLNRAETKLEYVAKKGRPPHEVRVGYVAQDDEAYTLRNCKLVVRHSVKQTGNPRDSFTLSHEYFLDIILEEPLHYEAFFSQYLYAIQRFVAFGTGTTSLPETLRAYAERDLGPGNPATVLLYSPATHAEPKKVSQPRMLFLATDLPAGLGTAIDRWITASGELKPLFDMYFATVYAPSMYPESKLLMLTQALETYHRRKWPGRYMRDEDFEPLLKALESEVQSHVPSRDVRQALCSRLSYMNEFSLRTRLKELVRRAAAVLAGRISDPSRFVAHVVDTRNWYVHFDPDLEKTAARGANLYWMVRRLQILIAVQLLGEMGLSDSNIAELLKSYPDSHVPDM